MTKETTTTVTYPIVSAIFKAEEFVKDSKGFTTVNEIQKKFLAEFYSPSLSDLSRIDEIESIAHIEASVINQWLKERGFSIKLAPFGPGGFGVASMMNLLGEWAMKGQDAMVVDEDKKVFPGVKMTNYGLKFYRIEGDENFVIELETKKGDRVYMKMEPEVPEGLDLSTFVEGFHSKMKAFAPEGKGIEGFIFPKIDLDHKFTLEWLLGFRIECENSEIPYFEVAQAFQQTKLKMNEVGFRVKSAVALGMEKGGGMPRRTEPYIINKPFLMWVTRSQFAKPLFVGYLNKDVWKNPEGLEM